MKKYKLIESNKVSPSGMPLFQVVALRDFGSVKKGDKGGYIKSEANLSHEGNCWVSGTARVFGNAAVFGNTWVYGNARVGGDVWFESGLAFATKNDHWDITEIDNGNGTSTLYADAVFEPAELKPCHGGQTGKFCSECGEKL